MAQRERSGILFRIHDKKNEKGPDFTGEATLDGKEYELAAWIREGQKTKFLSLKITPKGERRQPRRPDDDDTAPF